ncbi:MAG: dienelactone hydrolase family protein [Verrucomicrobiales bacterium]|jgi:carboxymethylenebutenolidase|nr:dienelactone hydrolase family protein [Verrucomicrobiales bacterium]
MPQPQPSILSQSLDAERTRREFLVAAAAAGIAVSVQPVSAQTMIVTPTDGLEVGQVFVEARDGKPLPVYYAAPDTAGKYATVLVIPEIWGAHEHIKDVARRLAKAGYFAVVLEPYVRIGDLTQLKEIKDVLAGANQLTDEQCFADLDTVVAWAEKQSKADISRLGITGFCRGGRTTWMYSAHSKRIRAGVAWYGGLNPNPPAQPKSPAEVAAQLNAPILGLYGGADQGIPPAAVDKLNAALKAAGKDQQSMIHVYADMPHAFHADYRPSYRKDAAEDGWKRMLAWFAKHGVK